MKQHRAVPWALAVACSALLACQPAPEPIHFGEDICASCRMTISDPRFGAELVTRKGRVYKFDDLACLFTFEHSGVISAADIHSRWVIDFAQPGELRRVEECVFVYAPDLHSPMGLNVYATAQGHSDSDLPQGEKFSWTELLEWLRTQQRGSPDTSAAR